MTWSRASRSECQWPQTGVWRAPAIVCEVAEFLVPRGMVFRGARAGALRAGERQRGVVGRVEDLEVREAFGEAHDDPPGGADDSAGHAEQEPS